MYCYNINTNNINMVDMKYLSSTSEYIQSIYTDVIQKYELKSVVLGYIYII